ncbi:hypothetical protein PHISCL_05226 [Aspergillus sclerotialis]|uniref:Ribosomal protein S21 n=1 Tax=Aspergillus sclerotialis TaxID=2070753 RepID=A0A3A2ZGW2_9EURO|nr:hypothetical protein PHISCL_05226 [Aspergillus sclerotialis]
MEARSLVQCLRSRPASSLLVSKQPSILHGQPFYSATALRYSSTSNGPSRSPPANESKSQSSTKTNNTPQSDSGFSEIDNVFDSLNFQNRNTGSHDAQAPKGRKYFDADKYRQESDAKFEKLVAERKASQNISQSVADGVDDLAEQSRLRKPQRPEFKLNTQLGRQILVEPEMGRDLPSALRLLDVNLGANRVRNQKNKQKFHVRKGLVRKQLRMDRWRKLFKYSFSHTVAKVHRMKSQGW